MKKSRKRTNKNTTTEGNLYVKELNYDKLASAIVCASETLEKKKKKLNEEQNQR